MRDPREIELEHVGMDASTFSTKTSGGTERSDAAEQRYEEDRIVGAAERRRETLAREIFASYVGSSRDPREAREQYENVEVMARQRELDRIDAAVASSRPGWPVAKPVTVGRATIVRPL